MLNTGSELVHHSDPIFINRTHTLLMNYYDSCINCTNDGTQILCKNFCSGDEVPFTYVVCNCSQPDCTLENMKTKIKYKGEN